MASPLSGLHDEVVQLLEMDTNLFTLYIQGKPSLPVVEKLKLHRTSTGEYADVHLSVQTHNPLLKDLNVQVYSLSKNQLVPYMSEPLAPLFFENETYTISIYNKGNYNLGFDHIHPQIRHAVKAQNQHFLVGSIEFKNEVGLTDLHVTMDGVHALTLTIELFPTKIDYKSDYEAMLREVNEEIYNLSFDFLKKTYQTAGVRSTRFQSLTEFFSILKKLFDQLVLAINRIQEAPHHKLERRYEIKDAALVRQAGRVNLQFLRRNPHYLVPNPNGNLKIEGKSYFPKKLIETKSSISFDTLENQFLKWMLGRIEYKLRTLKEHYLISGRKKDPKFIQEINHVLNQIRRLLQLDYIQAAGPLKQISISLVLQMAPGYRDAYKIYLMLMKGLTLQGDLFKISLKDVAQLYEYWCFLKMNALLKKKYQLITQDAVKVNHTGIFVTLDRSRTARMEYKNPDTGEMFELYYNNATTPAKDFPTIPQRPDNVFTIRKSDSQVVYKYVFDAKYRLDPAIPGTPYYEMYGLPGPLEEDINTMHRYRDAIVYQEKGKSSFERAMFGAYVLFPYHDEQAYQEHRFYKSIKHMNIGAFPFLPNATSLLEKFLDELILDSPEKAFHRALLQAGTHEFYREIRQEKDTLVIPVNRQELKQLKHEGVVRIPLTIFKHHQVLFGIRRIAIFQPSELFPPTESGIFQYGIVKDLSIVPHVKMVQFNIERWVKLDCISPGVSGIQTCLLTSSYLLDRASFIEELRIEEETDLAKWSEYRRKGLLFVKLDHKMVDLATKVTDISLRNSQTGNWED